jgi:hypothetical protein
MVERVSVKTVPSRCPRCPGGKYVPLAPMAPDVEPTVRFLPITGVLEIGGRAVLGLVCGKCGELLAEGERPLSLRAGYPHHGQCSGAPDILNLLVETYVKKDPHGRRHDGANITIITGCRQCRRGVNLETTVSLRRNEYDQLAAADIPDRGED